MDQPIVILSIVPVKQTPDHFHYAALKIQKDSLPKICVFSTADDSAQNSMKRLASLFEGSYIVVFNNSKHYISHFAQKYGIHFPGGIITLRELVLLLYPTLGRYELGDLITSLQLPGAQKKHRSEAQREARFVLGLLTLCWRKGLELDLGHVMNMLNYTRGLPAELFFAHLRKEITRQFPDRPIRTGDFHNSYTDDDFGDLFLAETAGAIPASESWAVECFQQGGLLSQHFSGFENRVIQVTMAQEILNGLNESRNIMIEAGTGTGKSMAYLIPALWWVKKHETRMVIATHTITLQEQLYTRDLPFLHQALPFTFKSALLKGKSNYLCIDSFLKGQPDADATADDRLAYSILYAWARETTTGDLAELPQLPAFYEIWKHYSAENPLCNPGECPHAAKCFLLRARKKADAADLIIINHSLLLADIKTNNKILPEYYNLIIDEAHNIHQTALKQLGFEICPEQISRLLEVISGSRGSLVSTIMRNLHYWRAQYPQLNWHDIDVICQEIPDAGLQIMEQSKELFRLCASLIRDMQHFRISEERIGSENYCAFLVQIENVLGRIAALQHILDRLASVLAYEQEQFENIRYEIVKNKNELNMLLEGLKEIIDDVEKERVVYLERSGTLYLKNTLIDISATLNKHLFSKNNCTILTSATLAVANSFDYIARDLGVGDYQSLILDSPFNYNEQMMLCVVNDMRVNNEPEWQLAQKTALLIKEAAVIMNGRTLVLFTSHRYLRLVSTYLRELLADTKLSVLAQGIDGSRDSLLHQFMADDAQILLGTNSFWEGIDLPGDVLKCVIIARLPFWPPDTPILEAKSNLMQNRGLDPFQELHLPEAIIRFKQGFGRLIRTKTDRGVVIVLDDRIIKKSYGRYFLKSLPITRFCSGSSRNVIHKVTEWA